MQVLSELSTSLSNTAYCTFFFLLFQKLWYSWIWQRNNSAGITCRYLWLAFSSLPCGAAPSSVNIKYVKAASDAVVSGRLVCRLCS